MKFSILILSVIMPFGLYATSPVPSVQTLTEFEGWAGGSPEVEAQLISDLAGIFKEFQIAKAKKGGTGLLRGTHSKGRCVSGNMYIFEDDKLAPETKKMRDYIRRGVFKFSGKKLAVKGRFSNAESSILPDYEKDVRALSMSVDLPNAKVQHFAMNNTQNFQIPDLVVFNDIMRVGLFAAQGLSMEESKKALMDSIFKSLKISGEKLKSKALGLPGKLQDVSLRTKNTVSAFAKAQGDKAIAKSFDSQFYHSTTSWGLGKVQSMANVVKFGTYPCALGDLTSSTELKNATLEKKEAEALGTNYLMDGLTSKIDKGESVCQIMFVQFLSEVAELDEESAVDLVENPMIKWSSPIHKVAKIEFNKNLDQAMCDDPKQFYINPSLNNYELTGLGQINRARGAAESTSRDAR